MRWIAERLVAVLTVSFLVAVAVAVVAQSEPSSLVFVGLAALAVTAVLAARYAAVVMAAIDRGVGERAPQHPLNAGRPQTRAPSWGTAAA
ncbi:MAG: hypothetical protein JWM51_2009 [Microbacteriaceae bacterium]|nr:hypothetical protein [Microbacteriaceae bacterium]